MQRHYANFHNTRSRPDCCSALTDRPDARLNVQTGQKRRWRKIRCCEGLRTSVNKRQKQPGGMHMVPIDQSEHMHLLDPAREVARNPTVAVVGLKDPGSYLR